MRQTNTLVKRIHLDESDLKKMHIEKYIRLERSNFYVLRRDTQRYVCRLRDNEYEVLGMYEGINHHHNRKDNPMNSGSSPFREMPTDTPRGSDSELLDRLRENGL